MSDNLKDPLDFASNLAERERENALAENRRRATRDTRPLLEGETQRSCAGVEGGDCDELVEPHRLVRGAIRCQTCQEVIESMRKRGLKL